MKSIKPGRGPSMMSGVIGIFMVCFGILWTVFAAMANPFFALFGVFWTGCAIGVTVHHFKNATGKNRASLYDVVDSAEEADPFEERYGKKKPETASDRECRFCPYCGTAVEEKFEFCPACGKKLP